MDSKFWKGGICMRKLHKGHIDFNNSIEAYGCSCGCSCSCSCFCFLTIGSASNKDSNFSSEASSKTSGALNNAISS